jgi:V/A-type H+-transporting ATPase subunit C
MSASTYLNTRVSLFATCLWRAEDFGALLATGHGEMAGALAGHGLPQLAAGFDTLDNRSLEQRIISLLLDETTVLIRPLSGAPRNFLIYWIERFEIGNLKTLLRGKMTGERPALILSRLTPMGAFGRLDIEDLAHAEDVGDLLRRLEVSHYADIVRPARRAFEESHDPFILDAALDRSYYEGLEHRALPLEAAAGNSFRRLMSSLIDRLNLVWLLRYRFNYKLPPAQVYYLLVASRYTLSSAQLRKLAALGSQEEVLSALPESLRRLLAEVSAIPEVFAKMEHNTVDIARKVLHAGGPAISRAFAYLIVREHDLRAVRAVLRGRLLGLPEADIRLAMFHPSAGSA